MRDLSGTGQVYRFTLSQLLKSRANRVTLIIMVLLAAVSMPLTALLGGETPETSDTAGLASVRVDNRTDLVLDFSGDAYWADTNFSADAGEPDAVVTITGDETGYQVAVVGSEAADAGELSQLAETARQAVRDACLQAAGLSSRQLEALTASTGEEDSHEDGFWVQYGYSILAMILCLMSASYVIRAGGGVFHPVPRCEYFLRPGAVCRGQCVLLAGAGVLGDPGGGDLGFADPGVPGICGTHRPPGQPGEAA